MATDFFGYNREIGATNQISSSEYAALTVGSKVNLCQSVNTAYQQEVRPVYEVGNPAVYFINGHASGTIGFGRLAGAGGFFQSLRNTKCGNITPVSINSQGSACFAGSGTLNFSGAVLQQVSLTMNTGQIEISESAHIKVASMS